MRKTKKWKYGLQFVIGPVSLLALALVLLAAVGLRSAALKSDQLSIDRQTREVELALATAQDDLAQSQAGVAIWNLALIELRRPTPNWSWFDANLGEYLHALFGHNADFILSGTDRPLYAMIAGKRVSPDAFTRLAPTLAPMIDAVRGRILRRPNRHERLPYTGSAKDSSARTSRGAIHATDLINLGGRPAAVSVIRMIPDTKAVADTPGAEPLLVSIRYLDAGFVSDLARTNLIEGARVAPKPGVGRSEYAIPLRSSRGERLGFLVWRPERPGTALFASMAPLAGIAVFLLTIVLLLLALRLAIALRRMARAHALLRGAHRALQDKEAEAQYSATHDNLTGLPNRAAFNRTLDRFLASRHDGGALAVLLLDLDRFKYVNDTLGHAAGDELLQQAATRIAELIEPGDLVARLGGDEFALLVRSALCVEDAVDLAQQLCATFRQPFNVQNCTAQVHASIGIVVCDEAPGKRSEIMRRADLAMYAAKKEGHGGCHVFTQALEEEALLRCEIEVDLRHALEKCDQLHLIFQPRMDAATGILIGFESLTRWIHPQRGAISPSLFIPIAEEAGLIGSLGTWVLEETCKVAARWPAYSFAVNLSPRQLRNNDSAEDIIARVKTLGVRPEQIELEITEGVLLQDSNASREALASLRRAGFLISLDDFGTGFSSLNYLTRFEVDKIKIDRSFTTRLDRFKDAPAIISAVIFLGRSLGLRVSAEGVETAAQADFLRAAGCHELQGFLFSTGYTSRELSRFMKEQQRKLSTQTGTVRCRAQ